MFNYEKSHFLFWYIKLKSATFTFISKMDSKYGKKKVKLSVLLIGLLLAFIINVAFILLFKIPLTKINKIVITISHFVIWYYLSYPYIKVLNKVNKGAPTYKL